MDPLLLIASSAAVGWLFSELSQLFKRRAERHAAVGRALAELLEMRHHLHAVDLTFREIQRRITLSPAQALEGLDFLDQLIPPDPDLPKRYNEAVTALAAIDPLLAFQLRSKDKLPWLLVKLRSAQLRDPSTVDLLFKSNAFLSDKGQESLTEAIKKLALAHSIGAWYGIAFAPEAPDTLPKELSDHFDKHLPPPILPPGPQG